MQNQINRTIQQLLAVVLVAVCVSPLGVARANEQVSSTDTQTADELPHPYVMSVSPANGTSRVRPDTAVVATLKVTGGGIRPETVTPETVFLTRTSDGATGLPIEATVTLQGGGYLIVLQPVEELDPSVSYTLHVTAGVEDAAGQSLLAFTSSFVTSTSSDAPLIAFRQVQGPTEQLLLSMLAIGPDNRLYAGTLTGEILRYQIGTDGLLSAPTTIATVPQHEGGPRAIIGMVFDPGSTADNLILWISHNGAYVPDDAEEWSGRVARLSGADLETMQNYVVNLPHSSKDHMNNGIDFGPDGMLYLSVGSNNAMGAPDKAWSYRPQRLLSASVVRIDLNAISSPPLDVKTEEGGNYAPYAPGAPLTMYATGIRNGYDLVWHTNGQLYVPTNGSAGGGSTPATPNGFERLPECVRRGYTGPAAPSVVGGNEKDWLHRVVEGGYYGHPNPLRCEWVMNGGNPTDTIEVTELAEYPVGTLPDPNFRGVAYDFGPNKSANGVIEYTSDSFDGALKGKLMVVRWSAGDDIIVLEPGGPDLDIVSAIEQLPGLTNLSSPLDLIEDTRNGNIYVIEFGPPSRITLIQPLGGNVALASVQSEPAIFTKVVDGTSTEPTSLSIKNDGSRTLTINDLAITGPNADQFAIVGPPSRVSGQSTDAVRVVFKPTSPGPKIASLRISSDASDNPELNIALRGLGTVGFGGANEPSLQWILDTYGYAVNVGDPDPTDHALPGSSYLGDEVRIPVFERYDNANPVVIEPLAAFAPTDRDPVVRFGWYQTGKSESLNTIFELPNNADNGQRLAPPLNGGVPYRYDPGTGSFGFYTIWPSADNRVVYSDDRQNIFRGALPHHVRVFPLKDADGKLVPATYVLAFEDDIGGFDYQDLVVIVRNVRPLKNKWLTKRNLAFAGGIGMMVVSIAGGGFIWYRWRKRRRDDEDDTGYFERWGEPEDEPGRWRPR